MHCVVDATIVSVNSDGCCRNRRPGLVRHLSRRGMLESLRKETSGFGAVARADDDSRSPVAYPDRPAVTDDHGDLTEAERAMLDGTEDEQPVRLPLSYVGIEGSGDLAGRGCAHGDRT